MKYLIAGASTYGVDNMGDDAMLSCLIRGIRQSDKNSEIVFLARHPNDDFDQVFGLKSIQNLDHSSNEAAIGRFFLGFNSGDDRANLYKIRSALEAADLLIIGGNSLMEISENVFLRGVSSYATTLATFALFMGKPYALFGLNIVEPIKSDYVASQAKFLVENAVITTVREEEVLEYLSDVGVNTSKVLVTGDPAYGVDLSQATAYSGQDILRREGVVLDPSKFTVSFCLREEYWKSDAASITNLEIETCSVMRHVLARDDSQILFIPNCYYDKGHSLEDDRLINQGIRARFGDDPRVHYVNQRLNLYETLALFKLTNLHVSNRRHSNIFAAIFGKPFIPVNTSLKTHISSFVRDLEQSELLVSSPEFSTEVIARFDHVVTNYANVSNALYSSVKLHLAKGLLSATRITDLFKK